MPLEPISFGSNDLNSPAHDGDGDGDDDNAVLLPTLLVWVLGVVSLRSIGTISFVEKAVAEVRIIDSTLLVALVMINTRYNKVWYGTSIIVFSMLLL